eukprot:COSAG01_NODE_2747_length_7149_cov_5.321844_14_plen_154_part_00
MCVRACVLSLCVRVCACARCCWSCDGSQTRQVEVRFAVYNGNYKLFAVVQVTFDLNVGGNIKSKIDVSVLDLERASIFSSSYKTQKFTFLDSMYRLRLLLLSHRFRAAVSPGSRVNLDDWDLLYILRLSPSNVAYSNTRLSTYPWSLPLGLCL